MTIDDDRITPLADLFRGFQGYQNWHEANATALEQRWRAEQHLPYLTRRAGVLPGWSSLTGSETGFAFRIPEPGQDMELREQLICQKTGLSARLRASFQIALALLDSWKVPAYITEQASPPYRWLKSRLEGLQGSEYFPESQREELAGKLRYLDIDEAPCFEDIMALSFEDRRFGLALSFDVLEHVPDYRRALQEFARVLKPGGYLVLTAPFMHDRQETLVRATLDQQGEICHHLDPEYHGDPVSGQGVLCFQTFGWDILDDARQAGFSDAAMVQPWDISQGLIGGLWTLVARR